MPQPIGPRPHAALGWLWKLRGACSTANAVLFYKPAGRETPAQRQRREQAAKTICRSCPVIAQCKADGDARGDRWSIYAGLTPEDRGYNATTGYRLPKRSRGVA
jgi:WhiB family transcriptional regulator, redox-sensing transcriptional regulator